MSVFRTKVASYYKHQDSAQKGYSWADKTIAEMDPARLPNLGSGYSQRYRAAYAVSSIARRKLESGLPDYQKVFWKSVNDRAAEIRGEESEMPIKNPSMTKSEIADKLSKLTVGKGGEGSSMILGPDFDVRFHESGAEYALSLRWRGKVSSRLIPASGVYSKTRDSMWRRDRVWRLTPEMVQFFSENIFNLMQDPRYSR